MFRTTGFVLAAAALLFSGCVVESIHPFARPGEFYPYEKIEGRWLLENGTELYFRLVEETEKDPPYTELTVTGEDGSQAYFVCQGCMFDSGPYLDVSPLLSESGAFGTAEGAESNAPAARHMLVNIGCSEDSCTVSLLDMDKLHRFLKAEPASLEYDASFSDGVLSSLVLLGSTVELQDFITGHRSEDLFTKPIKMTRNRKWGDPTEPGQIPEDQQPGNGR